MLKFVGTVPLFGVRKYQLLNVLVQNVQYILYIIHSTYLLRVNLHYGKLHKMERLLKRLLSRKIIKIMWYQEIWFKSHHILKKTILSKYLENLDNTWIFFNVHNLIFKCLTKCNWTYSSILRSKKCDVI